MACRTWHLRQCSARSQSVVVALTVLLLGLGSLAHCVQAQQHQQQQPPVQQQQQPPVQQQQQQPPVPAAPVQQQQQQQQAPPPQQQQNAVPAPASQVQNPQGQPPQQQQYQQPPPAQQQQYQQPPPAQQQQYQQPPPAQQQQQPPPPPPQQQQQQFQQPPPPPAQQHQQQQQQPPQPTQQQYQQPPKAAPQQYQQPQQYYDQRPPQMSQQHYEQLQIQQQQQYYAQQLQQQQYEQHMLLQQQHHNQQQPPSTYNQQDVVYHQQNAQLQAQHDRQQYMIEQNRAYQAYLIERLRGNRGLPGRPVLSKQQPPWDEKIAVAMEYRVFMDAGEEDCFYQYTSPGASIHISFQVLRGGDSMAGFAVFHPNGTQIIPYEYTMSGQTAEEVSQGGYYAVCVDNQFARYSGKLISIYLTVIKYEEWTRYTEEISKLDVNINTFTNALTKVQHNIQAMMHHQNSFRGLESRDIGLLEDNRAYVQNWSIIQIIVVVATTTIQVFFVRKLFEVKAGSGFSRI